MICPACGADNAATEDTCFSCGKNLYALTKGALLSERYEILATLGRGGMGIVYKAHDRDLDETVAIKVLRSEVAQSPDMTRRFRNEIRLARRIRHKNVCGIHEYGQHAHFRYIVMEYVPGVDLKQILRDEGPLRPSRACGVAIQAAEGLQAIHDAGIVHRDLKTPNIMQDAKGVVRLMDFGIAKEFAGEGRTPATHTGLIVGTPEYMSPEQVRSETLDGRTDLYSLGIVIYELLTGEVPFHGETAVQTLIMHLSDAPRLDGNPAIPAPFAPVLGRALAKAPADRFRSGAELAAALSETSRALGPDSNWPIVTRRSAADDREVVPGPVPPRPEDLETATAAAMKRERSRKAAALTRADTPLEVLPSAPPPRPRWPARLLALGVGVAALAGALALRQPFTSTPAGPRAGSPAVTFATPAVPTRADVPEATLPPSAAPRTVSPSPPRPSAPRAPAAGRTESQPPASLTTALLPPVTVPTPSIDRTGLLRLTVVPWAEVTVDDTPAGTSPLKAVSLAPGIHVVQVVNPGYQPLTRTVRIEPGKTTILDIDLAREALPK